MGKAWRNKKDVVHVLSVGQLARLKHWLVFHAEHSRRSGHPIPRDTCSICHLPFCVGDMVVSRSRSRNYHSRCWDTVWQGGD
jgi:hypothetical protein